MTKLADFPPAACAVCFQAGSEKRYVDFKAAYDGPVLTLEDGRKQPIDDLVICEGCLMEAFALLDPQELKQEIEMLLGVVQAQDKEIEARDRIIKRLEGTTAELVEHPIRPTKGSAHYLGIPPDVKKMMDARDKQHRKYAEAEKRGRENKEKANAST